MSYFTLYEFLHSDKAVKYRIENIPSFEQVDNIKKLALLLDTIREKWGRAIRVTSGYRCPKLNEVVKGSKTSQHLYGEAADIEDISGDNKGLFNLIVSMIDNNEIAVGQIINEHNFSWLHISTPTPKHNNEILNL